MSWCEVCFRHCKLDEGAIGFCGARICRDGKVIAANYGRITSLALDPIEKKPLNRFFPGSRILSVGSYGCNLRCPFCQNSEISWGDEVKLYREDARVIDPEELVSIALKYKDRGNIGIAFTYNEPLVGYEFVLDTAMLSHEKGLKNVIVSNGTAKLGILFDILPYIDAMNIDLKCFNSDTYKNVLGGDFAMTKSFIEEAAKNVHVELTTLIVPGINDSEDMMREEAEWIASISDEIPLHVSRFHPCFHMTDRGPTPVSTVYGLAEIAKEKLKYVYTGNC
ncbi:MAG: AmmeMemoRadiSam system radical SAM enzyme [Clostridiales bacterium]|nr:AmmeMemoRadiSam system radical SAM enzyme [Clostridiales bacterium]